MNQIFDERQCLLGEGPLWHPERQQLFWFDILNNRLLTLEKGQPKQWQFDEFVSAAGWVTQDALLIASESQLFLFDLNTGQSQKLFELEADNPMTRSNDGRADAFGGFWIGTMGKNAETGAGSIYRFYKGEVRRLFKNITISNSICFTPDGRATYFADTATNEIKKVDLDAEGWPAAPPETFIDLTAKKLNPDGSVVDADGYLWNAQWGASRVARYSPKGEFVSAVQFSAEQVSCPAFGGPDLKTLFATSAADGLSGTDDGKTFVYEAGIKGQPEHRVRL
ncbi:SMP-30/gluconolactonase/LRE family protein [Roseibium denhamense]|uniref:Sugar lactone lactonase YvrE n=1 Tax=Roseibium denhamense TaxID=76305 RepID=A0ABY1NHY7_9HYPH|nr:SMP-30/gluconolactonase/LRE family protein [Roseibium denhamense]MTI05065.1 SMP-30/gluconolactonase/LRE family protein [Roseibium denhamense]SMP10180.1 Sugar lactone lactonase YvrE [Roseibium denhamense]